MVRYGVNVDIFLLFIIPIQKREELASIQFVAPRGTTQTLTKDASSPAEDPRPISGAKAWQPNPQRENQIRQSI